MTGLWTLVLLWHIGGPAAQSVVVPGFSSRETCMVGSQDVAAQIGYRWSNPSYAICVEVK